MSRVQLIWYYELFNLKGKEDFKSLTGLSVVKNQIFLIILSHNPWLFRVICDTEIFLALDINQQKRRCHSDRGNLGI
ncbi:10460_t:CDS:2 [Gigaspora rosea]|nr:10460_t:CDS:2 [Gigaspora rosea]